MITSHVEIGSKKGPLMFQVVVWHDNWRFYWEPFPSGLTCIISSSKWFKNFWVSAAGPIASLLLIIPTYFLISSKLVLIPFAGCIVNFIPFKIGKNQSDGYKMLKAWRMRRIKNVPICRNEYSYLPAIDQDCPANMVGANTIQAMAKSEDHLHSSCCATRRMLPRRQRSVLR